MHPGFVNTKMVSFQGQIEPEESVSGLTAIIDDNANASNSGRFWHTNGEFYLGSVLIFRQCQKLIHLYSSDYKGLSLVPIL